MPAPSPPTYAVLFRTHLWDGFVERQFERLKQRVGHGEVFVLLDESNGPIATGQPAVVSHTNASIEALGLAPAGQGNLLWYNGDYPLYYFFERHPHYDFYVMTEYDVCVNVDLDGVIGRIAEAGAGLLALTKGEAVEKWAHAASCGGVYPPEAVEKRLICLAAFSRAAICRLFAKRLAMSAELRTGQHRTWPFCEGYIPTELAVGGFRIMELSEFGSTDRYDWWPPVLEEELPELEGQGFIHPVLDRSRYIDSALRIWRIPELFDRRSGLRRRLSRVPVHAYGPPLAKVIWSRLGRAVRRRLVPAT